MHENWQTWTAGWEIWSRSAGHSEATLRLRRHKIRGLSRAYAQRDPADLTAQDLAAWIARPGWAPETRKAARAAVRSLWAWAYVSGQIPLNVAAQLPPVRIPQAIPRPVPRATARAAAATAGRADVRLMILLGLLAGMRRAEIARLRWDEVTDTELHVLGKGGKRRRVPLHPLLAAELAHRQQDPDRVGRYYRTKRTPAETWVFPGMAGGHVTPGHVGKLIAQALPGHWTAHTLRHRAGTDWYAASDRDLLAVAALLGHARVSTTQIYVQLPDDALVRAVLGVAA